jgi:hypothetical protein
MARRTAKKNTIKVDLSDYDPDGGDFSGGGGFVVPPGPYAMECVSATLKTSKAGNEMIEWVFKGTEKKAKGKQFFLHTVLDQPQKIGKTIEAIGLEFEVGEFDLDLDEVEGLECVGIVTTEEWNGEKRSKLAKVLPVGGEDSEAEEEEEEEKPAKKASNGKAKKPVKVSEDELKEMEESELEDYVSKHELEVDLSKSKTLTRKRNAVIEAATEADLIA